jgi:Aspartyl protease
MVNAALGASDARRQALAAAGQPIPAFVTIRALLDTGASVTCVDPTVIATLGLSVTGMTQMITPSTGATPHNAPQYDASLAIPAAANQPPLIFPTVAIVASELLQAQGFHALIGRNILSQCLFLYNGAMGLFTLAY